MDTKVLIKLRNRGVSMSKIPNGRYTKEFRGEAVKMVVTGGHSAGSAARRLSLPTSTLENWVRAHLAGKLGDRNAGQASHRKRTGVGSCEARAGRGQDGA